MILRHVGKIKYVKTWLILISVAADLGSLRRKMVVSVSVSILYSSRVLTQYNYIKGDFRAPLLENFKFEDENDNEYEI